KVDKTDALLGLHEAAKYMKHGTQAHLVIPSYLAYGVAGDGVRILGRETLVLRVTAE
ncbi:MAG: FKBP-type peptidyl-prolyl cis-trans isomerase, partial [Bacteroidales bacterium]|nr:FKBP-type peptidyl-prolyl cis-trans isomerase [Bacteroidales bacterium]